jgi:hypothetical protein
VNIALVADQWTWQRTDTPKASKVSPLAKKFLDALRDATLSATSWRFCWPRACAWPRAVPCEPRTWSGLTLGHFIETTRVFGLKPNFGAPLRISSVT